LRNSEIRLKMSILLPALIISGGCVFISGESYSQSSSPKPIPTITLAGLQVYPAARDLDDERDVKVTTYRRPVIQQDRSGVTVIYASDVQEMDTEARTKDEPEYEVVLCRISSYCPCTRCCGSRAKGLTKLKTSAWEPGIACDWSWLSPGTVVEIPGYGKYPIDDSGGRLKKRYWTRGIPRLDKRRTYHWQAREDGIDYVQVKIFKSK